MMHLQPCLDFDITSTWPEPHRASNRELFRQKVLIRSNVAKTIWLLVIGPFDIWLHFVWETLSKNRCQFRMTSPQILKD